jgi:hypothetical protein
MLALKAEFLTRVRMVTAHDDPSRSTPEWPSHPDRLYSARGGRESRCLLCIPGSGMPTARSKAWPSWFHGVQSMRIRHHDPGGMDQVEDNVARDRQAGHDDLGPPISALVLGLAGPAAPGTTGVGDDGDEVTESPNRSDDGPLTMSLLPSCNHSTLGAAKLMTQQN